jgi:transcriptional regulator with XRE-family HTH domain
MAESIGFAAHVRRLRVATGLNQSEFASELGVEQGTVSRWENGVSPSFENVTLLATFAKLRGLQFDFLNDVLHEAALEQAKKVLPYVPLVGSVLDDSIVRMGRPKGYEKDADVEAPARSTPLTRALLVETGDLLPLVPVRSILYFQDQPSSPEKFEPWQPLIVFMKNKTIRFGRLAAGPGKKVYFLDSKLPLLTDLVDRACPVLGIRFRDQNMR